MKTRLVLRGRTLPLALGTSLVLGACADAPTAPHAAGAPPGPDLVIGTIVGQMEEVSLAAADYHSLVVRPDGTVAAWGGVSIMPLDPPMPPLDPPPGLSGVVAISAGSQHALALRADGTVVGWGNNWYGQTNVPPLSGVVGISAGEYFSLAVRNDGTVAAWGRNNQGQTNVPAGLSNVVAVAAGQKHSLALRADGTVVAWGNNNTGQASPPWWLNGVVAIAAGESHSVALRHDGTVIAWGEPYNSAVPAGLSGVVAVSAGFGETIVLKGDGTVVSWGAPGAFLPPPAGLSGVIAIEAGNLAAIALRRDGTLVAWGPGNHGQATVPPGMTARVPNAAPWAAGIAAPAGMVSGHRYTFTVLAGDPEGAPLTYAWDMNADGTPEQVSAVAAIYHAFPTGGTHTVRVTITDARGASVQRSATFAAEQNVAPVAAIIPVPAANEGTIVYPRAVVTDANSATDPHELKYVTYRWDFGDGTTSTSATPSKRYGNSGTYRVQLTVTDRAGASYTTGTQVQIINLPPRATFMAPAGTTIPVLSTFTLFARSVTDPAPDDRGSLEIALDCGSGYYGWTRDLNAAVECFVRPGPSRHSVGLLVRDMDGGVTEYRRNYTIR